jgi:ADP-L-glycero-D-manno-heptose 6-epimerase
LQQEQQPPAWAGLKFFNVYGPNEYHKGRMASMIFHGYNQLRRTGKIKLFKSHRNDFKDGEQLRDFIYVDDVVSTCYWLMDHPMTPGLYNVGTGQAESFNALATAIFNSLGLEPDIEYIDMPMNIRDKYQYFTEADMSKLRRSGFDKTFFNLEEGVSTYVRQYLNRKEYY